MSIDRFFIDQCPRFDGQTVVLKGWVYNKRSSGKIKFLVLRDGTGMMQGVLVKGECKEEAFNAFDQLTQESAVEVTGKVRKEPRSQTGFEMTVLDLKTVQIAEAYPISPKEH